MLIERARQTVAQSYGDWAPTYLVQAGAERQRLLQRRAESLREGAPDLPAWDLVPGNIMELGGQAPNDSLLWSQVDISSDPRGWADLLSMAAERSVDVSGMRVGMVSQRHFDARLSRQLEKPVVAYSEGLLAVAQDNDGATSFLQIDRRGEHSLGFVPADRARVRRVKFPSRQERFSAFPAHLAGKAEDGTTVFMPIERSDYLDVSVEPHPALIFAGHAYEQIALGEPIAEAPWDVEPPDTNPGTPGREGLMLPQRDTGGGIDPGGSGEDPSPGTGGATVTTTGGTSVVVAGIIGISGSVNEGGSGQVGFGPSGGAAPGFGSCVRFNVRDECKNCCITTFTWMTSLIVAAGIACHVGSGFWCLPCHFACGFAEGAAFGAALAAKVWCESNCEKQVTW